MKLFLISVRYKILILRLYLKFQNADYFRVNNVTSESAKVTPLESGNEVTKFTILQIM